MHSTPPANNPLSPRDSMLWAYIKARADQLVPQNLRAARALLAAMSALSIAPVAIQAATNHLTEPVVMNSEAPESYKPLNVKNGCAIEAISFLRYYNSRPAAPADEKATLVMTQTQLGDHAFAVYNKGGKVYSHCTFLGDVALNLSVKNIGDSKKVLSAYAFAFKIGYSDLRSGVARGFPDSRPGDDNNSQLARAEAALEKGKVQHAVVRFTKKDGSAVYSIVYAQTKGPTVYSPDVGSVLLPGAFGPSEGIAYAKEFLGIEAVTMDLVPASFLPVATKGGHKLTHAVAAKSPNELVAAGGGNVSHLEGSESLKPGDLADEKRRATLAVASVSGPSMQ